MSLSSTGYVPASTISKTEADQTADQLLAAHWGAQRELAAAQALARDAEQALVTAMQNRQLTLQRVERALQLAEQFKREAFVAASRALSHQTAPQPVTAADYPPTLDSILPKPGGAYEQQLPAQSGPDYIASVLAACPAALNPDQKMAHVARLWRAAYGPVPTREQLGLPPAQSTNEPAKTDSKK
jgi:hypothetical protein